jgi:hypothetical protein
VLFVKQIYQGVIYTSIEVWRLKNMLIQLTKKGGEKASRNNLKCYSKQKETRSDEKLFFSRKHLSLETAYISLGISENLKNLLKIGTSGVISF